MRLWLSRSSEVPLREQLTTQITLGVVSGDLKAGQKLPSTRELARRFQIHSNTVSAAYRELHRRGWVAFRKGSGVYVRARSADETLEDNLGLDQLVGVFFKVARAKGHSLREIQSRLKHWLALQPPDHFLVIEPDPELRRILVTEIEAGTNIRTVGADLDDCSDGQMLIGSAPVTMYSHVERVRAALPPDTDLVVLRSRSIPKSLQGERRPSPDALIAIVSRWPEFLRWSRAILVAAQLDPNALSFRDARERGWQRGLRSAAFVVTDSVMAHKLPAGCEMRLFTILSDSSLEELQQFAKQFMNTSILLKRPTNPPRGTTVTVRKPT